MIKPEEVREVFMTDFESDEICNSYHIEGGKVKIWRINEKWNKVKRSKLSKTSNFFFRIP